MLIVVEFARRRRLRINGILACAGRDGLQVEVREAFGNCPQYIQARILREVPIAARGAGPVRRGVALAATLLPLRADTVVPSPDNPPGSRPFR